MNEEPASHIIFQNRVFLKDEVKVCFLGDIHIGNPDLDEDLLEQTLNYIKENGIYVVGMGDYIENANKYSVGGGVYAQELTPTEQLNEIYKLFNPIKEQILFLLRGNHEGRTSKHMGVDLTQLVADKLGVPYEGYGNFITIKAGSNEYRIYATHGHAGARKSHTKLNAVKQLSEAYDAHIYAMGHMHDLMFDSDQIWEIVDNKPALREKHFIITGHFLGKYNPHSYQQEASYQPGKCGSPIITLSGKEWNVKVEEYRG